MAERITTTPQDPEKQRLMFGQTIEQMESARPSFFPIDIYAMAILSDVQEVLHRLRNNMTMKREEAAAITNEIELCRQWINKSKYFITKIKEDSNGQEDK